MGAIAARKKGAGATRKTVARPTRKTLMLAAVDPYDAHYADRVTEEIRALVRMLGGQRLVLLGLKWRPIEEVFPVSPLANKAPQHWVPPYNPRICFAQTEAIRVAFSSWVWKDMANGVFDRAPRAACGIRDEEIDWDD